MILRRVLIAPDTPAPLVQAVELGGAIVTTVTTEADAIVWLSPRDADGLNQLIDQCPHVKWVQLPFAGVERFVEKSVLRPSIIWTCAKGAYAEPVAEHALALTLAALRELPMRALSTSWGYQGGVSLFDQPVTILGGGGIASALVSLLQPFRSPITVVRRHPMVMPGVTTVVGDDGLHGALASALVVVVAAALTPATKGLLASREFELIGPSGVLINVARGEHVVTDDLVEALRHGHLGAAALDVTDPEPLPDGHPLWALSNCLITPHTANSTSMAEPLLAAMVTENVRRFTQGEGLLGLVDVTEGY